MQLAIGLPRKSCKLIGELPSIDINQRADRYNVIGSVKSAAGRRTVDLGPETARAIRVWLMVAPKPALPEQLESKAGITRRQVDYVFPNDDGGVWSYTNFRARFWVPLMNEAV
jgi:integrase